LNTATTTSEKHTQACGSALSLIGRLFDAHEAAGRVLATYLEPVFNVAARIWMGKIFLDSGIARVINWGSQEFLFGTEYGLGLFPPKFWAIITTGAELVLPVLLFVGLFTRVPALGLSTADDPGFRSISITPVRFGRQSSSVSRWCISLPCRGRYTSWRRFS
jgi:hypothetical protein